VRGTEDLSPDRRPRGSKMTRRGQPYRKRRGNRPNRPTLTAMLKGAPAFLPNPMDAQRRAVKRRGR
jgi:hypothetical protein